MGGKAKTIGYAKVEACPFPSGESPLNLFHLQILVGEDNVVDRGENAKQRLECLKELHNWGGMVLAHLCWAGLIINISLLNA